MRPKLQFTDNTEIELGTLFCVAANYSKHAAEMGLSVPENPSIFLKPAQAYVPDGGTIYLPSMSDNVHHEVELVVIIGDYCSNVEIQDALSKVAGYAVGIDVTMRDLQAQAKKEGKPWAICKGFHTSAPISKVVPVSKTKEEFFDIELKVNGELRQKDTTKNMARSVSELISYLSQVFTLLPGDVIFTGTPEGVGKIIDSDVISAELCGYESLKVYAKNKV